MNAQMKSKLTRTFSSPQLKQLVADYLVKRAESEVLREQVDAVYLTVFEEIPIFATFHSDGHRITSQKETYLCEDESAMQAIYTLADERLKAAGIKPASMGRDYCPALVAESELTNIRRNLINCAGKPLGIDAHKLLCNGLDTYYKFVDLVVGGALALERETA